MKHILCPTNGSEHSFRAVALAAQMALGMNCKLTVLTVKQYIVGRSKVTEMWNPDELTERLKQVRKIANDEGVLEANFVELRARDVAHSILEYAETKEVDHIVHGAAGTTGVAKFLLGSVTTEVLKKSFLPITVVH
jgi:nucleotide-binding universal stress UspA family protein